MRVVLDTNVPISALIAAGSPYRIYQAWLDGAFELITSAALLGELEVVITRPHVAERIETPNFRGSEFIGEFRKRGLVVTPGQQVDRITIDPPDNRVLEAAVEGRADYIVTGDRQLLDLKQHESPEIVTPAPVSRYSHDGSDESMTTLLLHNATLIDATSADCPLVILYTVPPHDAA
jgi:putative PIN family toxin of toxin-antitoxin system